MDSGVNFSVHFAFLLQFIVGKGWRKKVSAFVLRGKSSNYKHTTVLHFKHLSCKLSHGTVHFSEKLKAEFEEDSWAEKKVRYVAIIVYKKYDELNEITRKDSPQNDGEFCFWIFHSGA